MVKTKRKIRASGPSNPFLIGTLVIIAFLAVANIPVTQNFVAGTQNVLGEEEENEEQKQAEEQQKEAEKKTEETQKESEKQVEEQQKEAEKTATKSKTETTTSSGLKMKTQSEGKKEETEIETADGQKIKTKIEDDGTTKIEIENGTVKLKYSIVNGQVVLNAENEDGDEVEIEDIELEELENEVENELEDEDVKIIPTADNQLALTQNNTAALTNFPLSIDVETRELIITTPSGQKVVTVLPDEAVQNLLATGVINSVEPPASDVVTQDQLGTLTGVVEIETRDNETVYKVKGRKKHLVLGVFSVTMPVTAFVSTDTGQTVAKQQSLLTNVVDFLSL